MSCNWRREEGELALGRKEGESENARFCLVKVNKGVDETGSSVGGEEDGNDEGLRKKGRGVSLERREEKRNNGPSRST
jgi:hypothetical protein